MLIDILARRLALFPEALFSVVTPQNSSHAQSLFPAHLPLLSLLVPAAGWIHLACFQGFSEMLCYWNFKCLVPEEVFLLSFIPGTLTGETAGRAPGCLPRCSPFSATTEMPLDSLCISWAPSLGV